jgi:tetratricopeptide (TPR) repeat protein
MSKLKQLISEIHRRSLWQVLLVYLGVGWAVLEAVSVFSQQYGLPPWLFTVAFLLLLAGLIVVLALALMPVAGVGAVDRGGESEDVAVEPESVAARHRILTWRNAAASFVVAFALWGFVAAGWLLLSPTGVGVEEAFGDVGPGIAVLPFDVHGEDLELWREGMVNLLSIDMNGVGGLRAIDSRTLMARWREKVPERGEADRAAALEVARITGARYALLGSAVAIGPVVRLSADLYDIDGAAAMGSVQVEGTPDSVLALVDRLAVQSLVVLLEQEDSAPPQIDLASVTTASVPALKAWLEAEALHRRGEIEAAIAAYERAVAADSTFALAFYGLYEANGWYEGPSDRTHTALGQAMRWVDRLPAREAALVQATHARLHVSLREAEEIYLRLVRTYPDYAMAWYGLGELYFHGDEWIIPVTVEDAHRCFARAVELDPQFAPYRIHLIDLAFLIEPDSAKAARLIADYRRLSKADRQMEIAFNLAFGDREHREGALASLDTLDLPTLFGMAMSPPLIHPRFWPQFEAVWLARERREYPPNATRPLFRGGAMGRGYLSRALEYLDRPQATADDRGCLPVDALVNGFPVPPARLEEAASVLSQIDSTSPPALVYCSAFLAAAQGRWADHARAVELAWDLWRRRVDAGDAFAMLDKANALAMEAYGLWLKGEPEAAVERLDEVRRYSATRNVRQVLGHVLMDLERWEEAVPYLRPYWMMGLGRTDSHMNYHLARAYETTGEYAKAAKEYAFFIEAWADADPELQPWVEDARRALARLSPDR